MIPIDSSQLLDVKNLTIQFGGLTALKDISFQVQRGEITALIGPNGAGKTTFFNCLTGFYHPDKGVMTMTRQNGKKFSLEKMSDYKICHHAGIARTFQNIRLFKGMTVLENLLAARHHVLMKASFWSLAGLINTSSYRKAEKKSVELAMLWLEKINLQEQADRIAGSLSYGNQRRLEIVRALMTGAELLCLDEPAAGLNPKESEELNHLLIDIQKNLGLGILLIEHDMRVVMTISHQIIVLDHGELIAQGSPDFIRKNPEVIKAYLGLPDSYEAQHA
jgi:branched-chain amino acid transport system ATP-binding protein